MPDENVISDERRVLSDGRTIPTLGLGVWQVPDGPECVNAVRWALELGYRHIDTAQAYGNEESVGQGAARERGAARGGVHHDQVLSRAQATRRPRPSGACERLGVDHVDLYIVHWPQKGADLGVAGDGSRARARLRALDRGLELQRRGARRGHRRGELAASGQSGAVQPVRVPAGAARSDARHAASRSRPTARSAPDAISPTRPSRRSRSALGRTPAQVLLRWCIQRETIVLPKSTHRERIEENAQVFDFALSDEDMATLDGLDQTGGTAEARERKWWG